MYINRIDDKVKVSQKLINFDDPPVVPAETALHNDIYQLMAFVGPEQERTLMDSLPHCDSTRWNPYFIDVVPAGGSKRLGIDAMIRAHGIDLAETRLFGDGQNDTEMLQPRRNRSRDGKCGGRSQTVGGLRHHRRRPRRNRQSAASFRTVNPARKNENGLFLLKRTGRFRLRTGSYRADLDLKTHASGNRPDTSFFIRFASFRP